MPWLSAPKARRVPATLEDWMAETRTTRATCGALASSVATLTLEIGRLEQRLEAVMVNGLPAHRCEPCPTCPEVTPDG